MGRHGKSCLGTDHNSFRLVVRSGGDSPAREAGPGPEMMAMRRWLLSPRGSSCLMAEPHLLHPSSERHPRTRICFMVIQPSKKPSLSLGKTPKFHRQPGTRASYRQSPFLKGNGLSCLMGAGKCQGRGIAQLRDTCQGNQMRFSQQWEQKMERFFKKR